MEKLNLYNYLPNSSAHPPGVLRGLIFGRLQVYYSQNTDFNDYKRLVNLLYQRLLKRGHKQESLRPVFEEAHRRNLMIRRPKKSTSRERLTFFHLQYHPDEISRKDIRKSFVCHCSILKGLRNEKDGKMNPGKLTIAYKRAPNLKDKIWSSTLRQPQNKEVSTFLEK